MGSLDVLLIVHGIKMSYCVSGIEEKTGVTTVSVSSWVYHCEYARIGVCGCVWVVVLGVLL